MKNTVLILFCLLSGLGGMEAQTYQVNGFIRDSFTREGLASVSVAFLSTDSTEVKRFVSKPINAQMQTETYANVLRRYLMLNLTFRLNKEPKK